MDESGRAVSAQKVAEEQAYLDPVPGAGKGQAPPGATVTVSTPSTIGLVVNGTIAFKEGFSLDGGGGLVALRARIEASVESYVNSLEVGEDVVYDHVKAQMFTVQGVYSVSGVTVNGGAADIPVGEDPPQLAVISSIGLV